MDRVPRCLSTSSRTRASRILLARRMELTDIVYTSGSPEEGGTDDRAGAITGEVVGKIVHLRKTYHFGPQKISMYLKRYHDIQISRSGVWRILKRLEMNRLPSSQRYRRHVDRWKRYEKQQPGHRVQIDVKFVAPLKGSRKKHYQFTAIDDCTRIRVLRIYDRLNQRTAIRFVDYVCEKLPFAVEVIQTG